MVARAHDRVQETNDPTAHAVIVALREAARKLGSTRLRRCHDLRHPRALRDVRRRPARERRRGPRVRARRTTATGRPGPSSSSPSTIRCRDGSRSSAASGGTRRRRCSRDPSPDPPRTNGAGSRDGHLWYPLRRRGVRVVDGAALEKRCAKAPRVRIPPSPPRPSTRLGRCRRWLVRAFAHARSSALAPVLLTSAPRGRGRLVDYGAALEMRFGATHRGFESRPLRHPSSSACESR